MNINIGLKSVAAKAATVPTPLFFLENLALSYIDCVSYCVKRLQQNFQLMTTLEVSMEAKPAANFEHGT